MQLVGCVATIRGMRVRRRVREMTMFACGQLEVRSTCCWTQEIFRPRTICASVGSSHLVGNFVPLSYL